MSRRPSTPSNPKLPTYRHHKPTGQAVVTLSGHDFYLGEWKSRNSRQEYDRLIGEWLAAGRMLPAPGSDLRISELCLRYWRFAKTYYLKDGRPTSTLSGIKIALRHLRRRYGSTLAAEFGPLALEALQLHLTGESLSLSTINSMVSIVRRMFRWAVTKQIIPVAVYQALAALPGLKRGRTTAKPPRKVEPVSDDVVEATLPFLSPIVADMVRIQRLTGCRPDELCQLRPRDLNREQDVWRYRPESHKTEHHGRTRDIAIGPRAQLILRPYLDRPSDSYCFSPAESEQHRRKALHERRVIPLHYGNRPGTNRKNRPQRTAQSRYVTASYRRAICRAVERANVKRRDGEKLNKWSPNQLRHSAATEIRRRFGLESAQVILGHSAADVTQIYAERDQGLAADVMRQIG